MAADLRAQSPFMSLHDQQEPELEIEYPFYSYSPASSPQLTPTLETVSSFVGASFFPSFCGSDSSESLQSSGTFDLSRSSSSSSFEGPATPPHDSCYNDDDLISAPLQRSTTCRYAGIESAPMGLKVSQGSLGGVGMFRSFSNPVATLEVALARESIYAEELRRAQEEQLAFTSPSKRVSFTTEHITSPTPSFTASSLMNHPQDFHRSERRPQFGRFLSFEPSLLNR
jgi:hypothetical protein